MKLGIISDLECKEAKNNQNSKKKKKSKKYGLCKEPLGQTNIHIVGMLEGEVKEQEIGKLFQKKKERTLP